jgi:hypothetical protein
MRGLRAPALSLLLLAGAVEAADEPVRHSLAVRLDPATGHLRVTDTLVLPERIAGQGRPFEIALNAALEVRDSVPALEAAGATEPAQGLVLGGRPAGRDSAASVRRYTVPALGADRRLTLTYEGRFDFGLSDPAEEYTRGFRDTVGVVSPEGVYLAAAGFWYPVLDDGLTVYDLEVEQPEGWHVVSAGRGTSRGDDGRARWTAESPADEIYLVGGPLKVWRGEAGTVETLVYLR